MMKAVILRQSPPDRKPVYHDAVLEDTPIPTPGKDELLVKLTAVSFNRRDVCILMSILPLGELSLNYRSFGSEMVFTQE